MNKSSPTWNREQTLIALRVYCSEPFGRLHQTNPEIIRIAKVIDRTPSAVEMKACNLASLDPTIHQKGLGNCSSLDKQVWREFMADSQAVASEAEQVYQALVEGKMKEQTKEPDVVLPKGQTESVANVKVRRVQSFFRRAVMVSYKNKCALSDVTQPELLIASHIIPWRADESRRADPTNGILLNSFYDKAFDSGFITFDKDMRLVASSQLRQAEYPEFIETNVIKLQGQSLNLPYRFRPDDSAMEYHRNNIFRQ